jgi:glutathione S-transferase
VIINGDISISKYLIKVSGGLLYGNNDVLLEALIDQYIEYYNKIKSHDIKSIEIMLNTLLTSKTYLVGHFMTLADIFFYLLLKNNNYCVLTQEKAGFLPHTNR